MTSGIVKENAQLLYTIKAELWVQNFHPTIFFKEPHRYKFILRVN